MSESSGSGLPSSQDYDGPQRTALITGCDGPLGRVLCRIFKAAGYDIIGTDLNNSDLPADLETLNSVDFLVKTIAARVGSKRDYAPLVDVVVNNARVTNPYHIERLGGIARLAVVNVASIYGVVGHVPSLYPGTGVPPTPAGYAATKGATIALTRWLATHMAPVRVNCVCPGGIERGQSQEFINRYRKRTPMGRMAREEDIAEAVLFLASDKASYITGQILCVDGGWTAW